MSYKMITVFADASCDPERGVFGWAGWFKYRNDYPGEFVYGMFGIGDPFSNNEAELYAIYKTIDRASSIGALNEVDALMLQSDSQRALSVLLSSINNAQVSNHVNSRANPVRVGMFTLKERSMMVELNRMVRFKKVFVRHVKGHSKRQDGRHGVNKKCDYMAKKQLWEARKILNGQQTA